MQDKEYILTPKLFTMLKSHHNPLVCYLFGIVENAEEAKALIESGFEYVTEVDGVKLFKKRK